MGAHLSRRGGAAWRARAGRAAVILAATVVAAGSLMEESDGAAPAAFAAPFIRKAVAPRWAVTAAPDAFGASGEVKVWTALPAERIEFPLRVAGDPSRLDYRWARIGGDAEEPEYRPLGGVVVAPRGPGFYNLVIVSGNREQFVSQPVVAVMVPFDRKFGQWLNGYHMGYWLAERLGGRETPSGFIEVNQGDVDLPVSRHFRLSDFVTHDDQDNVWPKYVALSPRLLDKLELVLAALGADSSRRLPLSVHSGFRTPAHNAAVRRAARDSRHQHGDAADVAIDVNRDGRFTRSDEQLVRRAVEQVEREHPELTGGLGVYTSRGYRSPYVHIDARGRRTRWRG